MSVTSFLPSSFLQAVSDDNCCVFQARRDRESTQETYYATQRLVETSSFMSLFVGNFYLSHKYLLKTSSLEDLFV